MKGLLQVAALLEGLPKDIEIPGLKGNSNGLLVLPVLKAPLEHPSGNGFEAWVNSLGGGSLELVNTQLDVFVNAFCLEEEKKEKRRRGKKKKERKKIRRSIRRKDPPIEEVISQMMVSVYSLLEETSKASPAPKAKVNESSYSPR